MCKYYAIATWALGLCVAASSQATAGVIFTTSNVDTDINVMDFVLDPGSTTTGIGYDKGKKNHVINFETDQDAYVPSGGQAELAAVSTPFKIVSFTPVSGQSFVVIEFDPDYDKKKGSPASFTLTALDQFGNEYVPPDPDNPGDPLHYELKNGTNRVAAYGTDGTLISKITINITEPGIVGIKQVRISLEPSATPVPEPGTFALLALGGVGIAAFRRKKKVVAA